MLMQQINLVSSLPQSPQWLPESCSFQMLCLEYAMLDGLPDNIWKSRVIPGTRHTSVIGSSYCNTQIIVTTLGKDVYSEEQHMLRNG